MSIKASNDNHIYINEKLNKALTKLMDQKKKGKVGGATSKVTNEKPQKEKAKEIIQNDDLEFDDAQLTDREMITSKQISHEKDIGGTGGSN